MKQECTITPRNQSEGNVITVRNKNKTTVQKRKDSAALFVTKFTNHPPTMRVTCEKVRC